MKRRYGLIGLLSLIGVLGIITHTRDYYPFFAFALFFEYFFVKTDEMFLENMRKAASWAFYLNLATTAITTCYFALIKQIPELALQKGIGMGFGISLIVFSFVTAYFDWKERRGISND